MNNADIYNFVITILRKEKEGLTFTPDQFSLLLKESSIEKANDEFKQFELHRQISDSLKDLITEESVAFTTGSAAISSLTATYWHLLGGTAGGYDMEVVTEKEYLNYTTSSVMQPTGWCPIINTLGANFRVFPVSISSATVSFLSEPATPYLDWYYDADLRIKFLSEGQQYTLQAGETYIDKTDGTEFTAGDVIGDTGSGDDADNQTVEMSFPSSDRIDVAYKILQKLGIPINDQLAAQYGIAREQKELTK